MPSGSTEAGMDRGAGGTARRTNEAGRFMQQKFMLGGIAPFSFGGLRTTPDWAGKSAMPHKSEEKAEEKAEGRDAGLENNSPGHHTKRVTSQWAGS